MILPSNKDSSPPLNSCEEAFDDPSAGVSTKRASILSARFATVFPVRCHHINAVLGKFFIKRIGVVGSVTNEFLGHGFDHVKVERQLHQRDFVMVARMSANGKLKSLTVNDFHNLRTLPSLGFPTPAPPPLAGLNIASIKLSRSSMTPRWRS